MEEFFKKDFHSFRHPDIQPCLIKLHWSLPHPPNPGTLPSCSDSQLLLQPIHLSVHIWVKEASQKAERRFVFHKHVLSRGVENAFYQNCEEGGGSGIVYSQPRMTLQIQLLRCPTGSSGRSCLPSLSIPSLGHPITSNHSSTPSQSQDGVWHTEAQPLYTS